MRLDSYFEFCGDDLEAELNEIRLKNAAEDILDHEVEFGTMNNLRAFVSLARSVNENLVPPHDELAYEAMYRAVVFAYQVARAFQGSRVSFDAAPYLGRLFNEPEGYNALVRDTEIYLEDNPNLDAFLECYIGELDGGRNCPHLVETTAALVFMLTERALAEEFLAEETQHCSIGEITKEGQRDE